MKRLLFLTLALVLGALTIPSPASARKQLHVQEFKWRVCNPSNYAAGCETTLVKISGTSIDTSGIISIADIVAPPIYAGSDGDTLVLGRIVIYSDSLPGTYQPNVTALTVAIDAVDYANEVNTNPTYHQLQSSAYTVLTGGFITIPLLWPQSGSLFNELATNTGILGGIAGRIAIRLRVTAVTGVCSSCRGRLIYWRDV